jgi:hypothetical protein
LTPTLLLLHRPLLLMLHCYVIIMWSSTLKASSSTAAAFSTTATTRIGTSASQYYVRTIERRRRQQQQRSLSSNVIVNDIDPHTVPTTSTSLALSTTRTTTPQTTTFSSLFGGYRSPITTRKFTTIPTIPTSRSSTTSVFMSAMEEEDSEDENDTEQKTITSTWNVAGLKKEVTRLSLRSHKKISKASQRLTKAKEEVDRLVNSPDVTMEELEQCPSNVEELERDLIDWQTRLKQLNQLEVLLYDVKGGKPTVLPETTAQLALALKVNDEAPKREATDVSTKKKEKGPRLMTSFRLPYRRYYTENKTEIRVRKEEFL